MNCYLCQIELNQNNKSIEHIFINAIGGRLKSSELLCKKCNNSLGNLLDSELAKQCNPVMNFLLIDREKGSYNVVIGKTENGEEFILDGAEIRSKANFKIEKNGDNMNISFSGSQEKELKQYFKQLSKKYPQVKIDEVLEKANHSKFYLNEHVNVNFDIGGGIALRAIAKIAVNYYILTGGIRCDIEPIIDYISNGSITEYAHVHYYYDVEDEKLQVNDHNVYHYINLVGKQNEKILYCYIELFGAIKFIVVLSDVYQGNNLNFEYAYNLISKEEFNVGMKLNLTKEHLNNALNGKYVQVKDINEALNKVLKIGHIRQRDKHISNLVQEASQKTFGKYEEGIPITEDMLNEFIHEVSKSMAIFMTRKNQGQKRTYFK